MKRAVALAAAALLALGMIVASPASARDYGRHGHVWSIAEPDLLAQIHARLAAMEASGETKRLNEALRRKTIARVNRPEPVAGIVRAARKRQWHFDPTITVNEAIADDRDRTVIAAGTRVNPLDSVALRHPLVFLDGDDASQLAWASQRFGKTGAKFILVKGAPLQLMKALQRRFYFDQVGKLVAHFGIRAVPATVMQDGRRLLVTEEALPRPREPRS
ncbi:MAG: type-F conjugative transfer system protein TraW [Altererythrobacter sp.]